MLNNGKKGADAVLSRKALSRRCNLYIAAIFARGMCYDKGKSSEHYPGGVFMTITATKSWKNYLALCNVLERNDIIYDRDDRHLSVGCRISGKDCEYCFRFSVEPSKMLITLCVPVPRWFPQEQARNTALRICKINNDLTDGSFCYDPALGLVYYKMTASFYESRIGEELYEYMLSVAADAMDEYYQKLLI